VDPGSIEWTLRGGGAGRAPALDLPLELAARALYPKAFFHGEA